MDTLESLLAAIAPTGASRDILNPATGELVAKVAEHTVDDLNAAVAAALKDPELAKKLREQGGEPTPMSSQQFKDFIKKESVQFERIVTAAKIVAE
jgi:tripartite-type tricarboxylate transporter receptor subunit TctC